MQFRLLSFKQSNSPNGAPPVEGEQEYQSKIHSKINDLKIRLSQSLSLIGINYLGLRNVDMIIPRSSHCAEPSRSEGFKRRRCSLPEMLCINFHNMLTEANSQPSNLSEIRNKKPLVSFENGFGIIKECPKYFESKSYLHVYVRRIILPFHRMTHTESNRVTFHTFEFMFPPNHIDFTASLIEAEFDPVDDEQDDDLMNNTSMLQSTPSES